MRSGTNNRNCWPDLRNVCCWESACDSAWSRPSLRDSLQSLRSRTEKAKRTKPIYNGYFSSDSRASKFTTNSIELDPSWPAGVRAIQVMKIDAFKVQV